MSDQTGRLYERLLVMRCQAGDEAAFRELVEQFSPRLAYFLRKLLPRGDRADDFRQLPRLQNLDAFAAWIYRIARGKATLELRRNGQARLVADVAETEVVAAEPEPVFSPEDASRIHAALDQLPSEQREVLVLRFLEELS